LEEKQTVFNIRIIGEFQPAVILVIMGSTATANGIGYPTTVDSPSGPPTFIKRNPHLSGKIAIEEHVNTDIFNSLSTNP
jgi:hypothetical protein